MAFSTPLCICGVMVYIICASMATGLCSKASGKDLDDDTDNTRLNVPPDEGVCSYTLNTAPLLGE